MIPKVTDFNAVVAPDLKKVKDKYILWMICTFTRFAKGVVIKDKKSDFLQLDFGVIMEGNLEIQNSKNI